MNELTTEIIAALAQKQDLDEVFRHHLEIAINQLLQTELAYNQTHVLYKIELFLNKENIQNLS